MGEDYNISLSLSSGSSRVLLLLMTDCRGGLPAWRRCDLAHKNPVLLIEKSRASCPGGGFPLKGHLSLSNHHHRTE